MEVMAVGTTPIEAKLPTNVETHTSFPMYRRGIYGWHNKMMESNTLCADWGLVLSG